MKVVSPAEREIYVYLNLSLAYAMENVRVADHYARKARSRITRYEKNT